MAELDEERVLVESGFSEGLVTTTGADCEVDTEDHEDQEGQDLEG